MVARKEWELDQRDHRKLLIVDGTTAFLCGIHISTAMFNRDLAESDAITLEQWQQRPVQKRVKELFARLWEYWL